jgi:hypothetical protein
MLPVRCKLNTYMLFRRNSVFKQEIRFMKTGQIDCSVLMASFGS